MRPGFWQFVLVVGLLMLFFHRPLLAVLRKVMGLQTPATDAERRQVQGKAKCAYCGAVIPQGARFCPSCGKSQEYIDV